MGDVLRSLLSLWSQDLRDREIRARAPSALAPSSQPSSLPGFRSSIFTGTARFLENGANDAHVKLAVLLTDPEQERKGIYKHREASLPKTLLTAEKVMIACGTRPVRQEETVFDGKRVFDSDQVGRGRGSGRSVTAGDGSWGSDGASPTPSCLPPPTPLTRFYPPALSPSPSPRPQLLWGGIDRVPRSFIVVGAGVIGIEYASMINVLPGTNVTIIDPRPSLLGFADREVVDALMYSMRHYGARFVLGEKVGELGGQTGVGWGG